MHFPKIALASLPLLLLGACSDSGDQQAAPESKHDSALTEQAKTWTEETKKLGETALQASGEAADSAAETGKEYYEAARDKTSEAYESAKETTRDAYEATKDTAAEVYESARQTTIETYEATKQTTGELYEQAKEKGVEILDGSGAEPPTQAPVAQPEEVAPPKTSD